VVDLVDLNVEGIDDVVLEKGEVGVPDPVLDVLALAGEQVVHHVHDVALRTKRRKKGGGASVG
jgi:hypothetical protein